jgi:hypothetical protein
VTALAPALLAAAWLQAPQTPTFATDVEGVYLDVFVTHDGRPLTGLAERDFELRVDERRRAVELVAVESLPLRVFVVLDTSGSVSGEKLAELQAGVLDLLRGLRPGSWLDAPQLVRALEESNVLVQVVGSVPPEERIPSLSHVRPQPPPEPRYLRTLRRLAEVTGGQLWPAATPERLAKAFPAILEAMRTRYVLRFEPETPRRPGLHTIDVRLVGRAGKVQSRRAYFVGPASR